VGSYDDDEVSLLVFAQIDLVGTHARVTARPQGLASIVIDQNVHDCVTGHLVRAKESDAQQGSFLVTATLRCLGLGVRPGGTVAYVRGSSDGQASLVFRQAAPDSPVPDDATDTAVVPGWPGRGWIDQARFLDLPMPSPPPRWNGRRTRPCATSVSTAGLYPTRSVHWA
jgi:hypothetical protein